MRELRREGFGGEEMTLLGCRWRRRRLSAVPDDDVVAEAKIDNGTRRFIDGPS